MPTEPKPKQHRTPKEVAATMGVTSRAVRGWCSAGRYKVKRTGGGHYRLEVDEDGWPIEVPPTRKER